MAAEVRKPADTKITVEVEGGRMVVTVPARATSSFVVVLLFAALFLVALWYVIAEVMAGDTLEPADLAAAGVVSLGLALVIIWAMPRRQVFELNREHLRVIKGATLFLRRTMSVEKIESFVLRAPRVRDQWNGAGPVVTVNGIPAWWYRVLVATSLKSEAGLRTRGCNPLIWVVWFFVDGFYPIHRWPVEMVVAGQARQKDLPWLRELLSEHLHKVRTQVSGDG